MKTARERFIEEWQGWADFDEVMALDKPGLKVHIENVRKSPLAAFDNKPIILVTCNGDCMMAFHRKSHAAKFAADMGWVLNG